MVCNYWSLLLSGWRFGKKSRARGIRLACAVTKNNGTMGRSPTFSLKTSKTSPIHNHCHLQPEASQLRAGILEFCCMIPFEGHQVRSLGQGAVWGHHWFKGWSSYEGCDSKYRVECGELSPVCHALALLHSVVNTSFPLPDTHFSHLFRQPSWQSVRRNELAFGFTP